MVSNDFRLQWENFNPLRTSALIIISSATTKKRKRAKKLTTEKTNPAKRKKNTKSYKICFNLAYPSTMVSGIVLGPPSSPESLAVELKLGGMDGKKRWRWLTVIAFYSFKFSQTTKSTCAIYCKPLLYKKYYVRSHKKIPLSRYFFVKIIFFVLTQKKMKN